MARKRSNKTEYGSYAAKPHCIFRANTRTSEPSIASILNPRSFLLLDNLTAQLLSDNNGDLSAAKKILAFYGWHCSEETRQGAIYELLARGFIEQTRQGGRNKCSLYAVTWIKIHACNGKLDVPSTTVASNLWMPDNHKYIDSRWIDKWDKCRSRNRKPPPKPCS